jgi:hypothetical protein
MGRRILRFGVGDYGGENFIKWKILGNLTTNFQGLPLSHTVDKTLGDFGA